MRPYHNSLGKSKKKNYLDWINERSKKGHKKLDFDFDDSSQTLILNFNQSDPPNQQMKELQMELSLLEMVDLTGLFTVHINISNFKGELNAQEIRNIHNSLSTLSKVSVLRILERNEDQLQDSIIQPNLNPYSLLTFLSYENPNIKQKYQYKLQPDKEKTLLRMNSQLEKEYSYITKLEVFQSEKSDESYKAPLIRFYEIAKSILPEIISNNSLEKDPSQPQLQKSISLVVVNLQKTSQSETIQRLSSILNFFDLEESRISQFRFKVDSKKGSSEIVPRKMNPLIETNLELKELKQLKIAAKIKYYFLQALRIEQYQFFLELTKCIKSIKAFFDLSIYLPLTDLNQMLKPIKEIIKNGGCTQFKKLRMNANRWDEFDFIFQLAEALPGLKFFNIQFQALRYIFDKFLSQYFQRSMFLINKLDTFYVHFILRYKEKTLLIDVQQIILPSYQIVFDSIPPAINLLEKNINLEIIFPENKQFSPNLIYNLFKKLINLQAINQITFKGSLFDVELNSITQQRKQFYNSITFYYSLISPLMLFNPDVILLDLFEFDY